MISNKSGYSEAFVWIWLPGATEPLVAGKLTADADKLIFNYGKSYLNRKNAISIYDAELPLKPGALPLLPGLIMPGCIRDGAPDAWGRRVLINKKPGRTFCSSSVSIATLRGKVGSVNAWFPRLPFWGWMK